MEGLEQRKGTQRCPVVSFFPRVHSHGSRWPIHRGVDLRKQLLPGPDSNSWGYRTSLHRLHARSQWAPLCLHACALMSRLMPYACLEKKTGKNNTTGSLGGRAGTCKLMERQSIIKFNFI